MVKAFLCVISVILFAARPVGAASRMLGEIFSVTRSMALVIVLLPVPGPL
jgi:hypothetical protein